MTVEEEGQRIAEQLGRGFNYLGPQYENGEFAFHWIGDPVTGTSFAATSLEGAKRRLTEVRKSFSAESWNPHKVDRRKTMQEKGKISPTVALIPIGIGLGILGILALVALARAAQGPPPEPPEGLANLYGHATDKITGEPIVGIGTVYQDYDTDTESYDFSTNSQGYYEIRNMLVDVDVTKMVLYAEGYRPHTDEHVTINEGNNELNIEMVSL